MKEPSGLVKVAGKRPDSPVRQAADVGRDMGRLM